MLRDLVFSLFCGCRGLQRWSNDCWLFASFAWANVKSWVVVGGSKDNTLGTVLNCKGGVRNILFVGLGWVVVVFGWV